MYSVTAGSLSSRRRARKEEEKAEEVVDGDAAAAVTSTGNKTTPALLRIQKDLADLDLPSYVTLTKHDDMTFTFTIEPDTGFWKFGIFDFRFVFPDKYPFVGPKVTCIDKIYHPNIDLDGGVCVNVLRPWKPTYSTQIVLFGLLFLFTHPNPNDPLNQEAAKEMRENLTQFARNAVNAMKGLKVNNTQFPKNRGKGF